ncbi:MAG TPA: SpoVR family protein, partial [Bacteroidetes bacterium]|nr:SpoVR family protein [Bacteroidota bacterium]
MENYSRKLPAELQRWQGKIKDIAQKAGLDFYETIFEMLDFNQMNEVASYLGFPTRYPHWRFGMEYEEMQKGYSYGLHRIYEMVINNDPTYAYLLESNNLVDQKLVMAHVYAHVDFFKNNTWFSHTNRHMMDEMANHATRINRYIERYGIETVENFIDSCLSLENLIDYHSPYIKRKREKTKQREYRPTIHKLASKPYMDKYVNPPEFIEQQKIKLKTRGEQKKKFPQEPEKDVLLFFLNHAPLESWQQDVLSIIREEAYYFAPQGMTKIMN